LNNRPATSKGDTCHMEPVSQPVPCHARCPHHYMSIDRNDNTNIVVVGSLNIWEMDEVTPVDITAAGDAFVGGFAVALAEGRSLTDAVHWGNAAGALAMTKLVAQPSLPIRRAVEALIAQGSTGSLAGGSV